MPIERNTLFHESEFILTIHTKEQIAKTNTQLPLHIAHQILPHLNMKIHQLVQLNLKLRLDILQRSIGVNTQIVKLLSSSVIPSDLSLQLLLQMRQQSIVQFVVLAQLLVDLLAIIGLEEVLEHREFE